MSDEQVPADAAPVDANPLPDQAPQLPAHDTDEDPEEHMGKVIKDPWTDQKQNDWPNADKIELEDEG